MMNTDEPETYFLSNKRRYKFVTQTMLNTYEPETHLSHKSRYEFVTQTMLNTIEPQKHLSHKPCYKFSTQTMVKNNEPETYFCLINHVINLSHKQC